MRMMPITSSNGVRLPGTKTASAAMAARNASRMPVATRLLTSAPTPASSNGSFMRRDLSRGSVQSLDRDGGALARHPVSFENVGDVVNVPRAAIEGFGVDRGDGRPRDAAFEEGRHGDLVGPAQHRGRTTADAAGVEGEAQTREGVEV